MKSKNEIQEKIVELQKSLNKYSVFSNNTMIIELESQIDILEWVLNK